MLSLNNTIFLLINFILEAYIYILLLRVILQKVGATWFNPISQFTFKITEPLMKPLRRFLPSYRGYDLTIILWVLIFQFLEIILALTLRLGSFPNIIGVIIIAFASIGTKLINIYFYATIITAIISWFPALRQGPVAEIVLLLTVPLYNLAHRYIPSLGGIDFSPIIIVALLLLTNSLIFGRLLWVGMSLVLS